MGALARARPVGRLLAAVWLLAWRPAWALAEDGTPPKGAKGPVVISLTNDELKRVHEKADGDGNGKVSAKELHAFRDHWESKTADQETKELAEDLDSDKDGKIDFNEFFHGDDVEYDKEDPKIKKLEQLEKDKFLAMDKDKDGKLDLEELRAFVLHSKDPVLAKVFAKHDLSDMDTSGDQKVTFEEYWYRGIPAEEMKGQPHQDEDARMTFNSADTNRDGFLSLDELEAMHVEPPYRQYEVLIALSTADKDGDKHLDADELVTSQKDLQNLGGVWSHFVRAARPQDEL